MLRDEKLDFWIKNSLNVLFIGKHGIGKSTRVLEAFTRHQLKYKYFSAATMDPWVDFVGVPKEHKDENGSYIDLILPKTLRDDTLEAIFFDEFNRSHKKIRNAVMELVQFKSINGRKFHNLRLVWAAINPEENEEYQVEPLDPAQIDRFHVHVHLPYEPSYDYLRDNYGEKTAKAAFAWWNELPNDLKNKVSPRRLSYALDILQIPGGDLRDILPVGCNPSKLLNLLQVGPAIDKMKEFYNTKNTQEAKKYLAVENNYASAVKYLLGPEGQADNNWMKFFIPLLPLEKLASLVADGLIICNFVIDNWSLCNNFAEVLQNYIHSGTAEKKLIKRIKQSLNIKDNLVFEYGNQINHNYVQPYYNPITCDWKRHLNRLVNEPIETTPARQKVYDELHSLIPQVLSPDEALMTLSLLNQVVGRGWADKLHNYSNLTGIINHTINQYHKATLHGWRDLLTFHSDKLDIMLPKLQKAQLLKEIYCPPNLAKK